MNKFRTLIQSLLAIFLGTFLLFCTFFFIWDMNFYINGAQMMHFPYAVAAFIIILNAGFGIIISSKLILLYGRKKDVFILTVFSIYYLILQLFLTIIPKKSNCKCTTLLESVMDIQDWSKVECAIILFSASFLFFLYQKN